MKTVESIKEYESLLIECVKQKTAFDTETTGLKYKSQLLGISFYNPAVKSFFVPIDTFFSKGLPLKQVREVSNKYFPNIESIAHNAKFDLGVFESNGISDVKLVADTIAMIHCYNPDLEQNLEKRTHADFGVAKQKFEQIVGKKWDKINWKTDGDTLLPQLSEYACADTYYTYKLWEKYKELLEKEDLLQIHDKIELPMVTVLRDMFVRGVRVDVPLLNGMGVEIDTTMNTLVNSIHAEAGCVFNINSTKQKAEVLFTKMKLPCNKKTKTGNRATDVDVLEGLAAKGFPIAQYMVDYSELQKLNSGYVMAIPQMVDDDGMIRCNFNSLGTRTGRFSSNNPNLQNQPNNKAFPVRNSFIPRNGYNLLCADYSQIELRVMGHAAQDKRFMEAFWAGEDIHGKVASDLGIERKQAKVINFGVLYGMGPAKLAHTLGISEMEAGNIIRNYETTYSGYRSWKEQTERFAQKKGYIKTLFGRVRRLNEVFSENKSLYFGAMRKACNTIIQGSSADIIKIAMIELHKRYKTEGLDAHLLLQVHDELVVEAHTSIATQAYDIMKEVMENTIKLSVPLEVDGKILNNWGQMKDDNFITLYDNMKLGTYVPTNIIIPNKLTLKNEYPLWLTTLI